MLHKCPEGLTPLCVCYFQVHRSNKFILKGHIALGSAVFPEGTTGSRLDSFARMPLWKAGLDYNHGTGHGVGAFLNVMF